MNIGECRWSVLVVKMVHDVILKKGKKSMGNEITIEEKKKKVRDFRPIDDAFFEVLADDAGFCQEMLRILLDDDELIVEDVIVQSNEKNIYGRSVRLDALCTFNDGKKCNVEVQRSDEDDHLRRVRFNASSIAVKDSQMGQNFREIEDIIVVYISKFDIFNSNRVIYHVDSVVRETGYVINDGLIRVFANAQVKDGTIVSEYLDCFMKKEVNNSRFPELTKRMNYLKHQEGGLQAVCEVMERYEKKAAEEANIKAIKKMINEYHATKESILEDYTEEEYSAALRELTENM